MDAVGNTFNDVRPRKLYIRNFNFFNHGPRFRTIYAGMIMDNHTKEWFAKIDSKLNLKNHTFPHITIAKNITTEQFGTLWPFFEHIEYEEAFYSEELTILQRDRTSENSVYRPFKQITFADKKPSPICNSY